ncbi:MAG TPA: serine protease [Bacteroidia bacterium]|nr:serine protease [Bacteroidia bacterium]HRS59733.1 serine protease [Bacteroidia bacterium]HRU68173.1 serine protease [Bacteroidia bacterium]
MEKSAEDLNLFETVERYLQHRMTDEEYREFQQKMNQDDIFRQEVDEAILFLQLLNKSAERNRNKRRIEKYHAEMEREAGIISLKYLKGKRNVLIQFVKISAVAAVVALITTFIFLYATGFITKYYHLTQYNELKKDIATISKKQNSLWKALFSSDKKSDYIYSGTCFAVSTDGCLATSYHLVNGFDSFEIINETDSMISYRARLLFADPLTDLAIIKIVDPQFKGFHDIPYGISQEMAALGEQVFTLGYSKKDIVYGEGSLRSVTGFNSDTLAYEISIPVNPGTSGAPLLDSKGNLIGIITARDDNNDGSAYAVKSMFFKNLIEQKNNESDSVLVSLSAKNKIRDLKRINQVSKLKPFIFRLEVKR